MQESYHSPDNVPGSMGIQYGSCHSGVMWGAIIGGALTTSVVALVLLSLASALGFAALSPWGNLTPAMEKAFAISGALALIVVQWVSSAFGGYLTGRLRMHYVGAHTHEVFFRDTLHGFLSWALATVFGIVLMASAAAHMHSMAKFGPHDPAHGPDAYFVDRLFATPKHNAVVSDQDRAEAMRALGAAALKGDLASDDKDSLSQLVAARTGLSGAEAEQRVDSVLGKEKAAMDHARKDAAATSLFFFFSMMIGAFIASVAGGLGGQHRDLHYTTGKMSE